MARHLENRKDSSSRTRLTLALLAVAGLLLIVTCTNQLPTDSSIQGTDNQFDVFAVENGRTFDEVDLLDDDDIEIDTLVDPEKEFQGLDTVVIVDPQDGGRLYLTSLDETSYFDVPADGLGNSATIQIQSWETRSSKEVELEFHCGPSGLTFLEPAKFVLERRLFEVPSLPPPRTIIWEFYDQNLKRWVDAVEIEISSDGEFHIPVSHFSAYRGTGADYDGISQGGQ